MFKYLATSTASVVALGISLLGVAHAQPNEALIASLIRADKVQAAYQELTNSEPEIEDVLFFRALLAQHRKEYDEAAALLNEAIIANPNHLNARRELANTLFLHQKYRLAEQAFHELIEFDSTPNMDGVYEGFINEIRSRKPFGITGHFSILPSSNVNRGTENLVFDSVIGEFVIDPDSRASSGIGLQAGTSGFYRIASDGKTHNVFSWGLNGTVYEASAYNTATVNFRFSQAKLISDVTRISYGAHARYTWRSDDADNSALGLSINLQHALNPHHTIHLAQRYKHDLVLLLLSQEIPLRT